MDETCDTLDDTTYFMGTKTTCKSRLVLNLSQAKRIECAVRAVIKLYCTDVSYEWVSCLHMSDVERCRVFALRKSSPSAWLLRVCHFRVSQRRDALSEVAKFSARDIKLGQQRVQRKY